MSGGILSTKSGIEAVVTALFVMGAICPKCGHGTRKTSKRWAKCKKCGERVARVKLPPIPAAADCRSRA